MTGARIRLSETAIAGIKAAESAEIRSAPDNKGVIVEISNEHGSTLLPDREGKPLVFPNPLGAKRAFARHTSNYKPTVAPPAALQPKKKS
jgi:hypothetical protein